MRPRPPSVPPVAVRRCRRCRRCRLGRLGRLGVLAVLAFAGGLTAGCDGRAPTTGAERAGAPADAAAADRQPTVATGAVGAVRLTPRVLAIYPHDPTSFTQGLLLDGGVLYESTGQYGRSEVLALEPESGRVLRRRRLADDLFGEGLALAGGRLLQLTWREGVALAWRPDDLEPVGRYPYAGEGWGLTFDGERLIASDGSATLTFRDPQTFAPLGSVEVTLDGRPLGRLNELEWAEGALWANVWSTDTIVRIDPATGRVTAVADCAGLLDPAERRGTDVLNGIAWWPERGTFLVTGKLWPKLFEVVFE